MRNALREKLHSQTGASLLIALLFFLAALTVGAVVLTAAATNAGRLARNRREQQDYLAVASAALLVKEDFRETAFTVGHKAVTTITTNTWEDDEGNSHTSVTTTGPNYSENPDVLVLSGNSELLKDKLKGDLAGLYYSTVPELNESAPMTMEYDLEIKAEDFPDVLGRLKVDQTDEGRYTITVELYTQTEGGVQANTTVLLFTSAVNPAEATTRVYEGNQETITTTYTTTVTWGTPAITKGAAA